MKNGKYVSFILFILGFGIFIFTRMSKLVPTIPVSILVASVFILRQNSTNRKKPRPDFAWIHIKYKCRPVGFV